MPQSELGVKVHNLFGANNVRELPPPAATREYPRQQASYDTKDPIALDKFGPTIRAPLGYIVGGRVGTSR